MHIVKLETKVGRYVLLPSVTGGVVCEDKRFKTRIDKKSCLVKRFSMMRIAPGYIIDCVHRFSKPEPSSVNHCTEYYSAAYGVINTLRSTKYLTSLLWKLVDHMISIALNTFS